MMGAKEEYIMMNDEFDEQDTARYIKSYMFIKGFAFGKDLRQVLVSLAIARKLHDGQYRKDGAPYLCHPLKVCTTLISYGVADDVTLSAALLHDVLEDCQDKLPLRGRELVIQYNLEPEVLEIIKLLTKESGLGDYELGVYFKKIEANPKAALIKLSDRLHNSSTLYTFSNEKMRKYLRETQMFLIPMASYCKKYYPEFTNAFGILKRNIEALNSSMKVMLEMIDSGKFSEERSR
ncbi:MAG: HD domain-containing protein [Clostridia bacterium]|nr:HD domain-containing protein [Clostridia bacterium]